MTTHHARRRITAGGLLLSLACWRPRRRDGQGRRRRPPWRLQRRQDWKLKLSPQNGRIEVEGEVDQNRNGVRLELDLQERRRPVRERPGHDPGPQRLVLRAPLPATAPARTRSCSAPSTRRLARSAAPSPPSDHPGPDRATNPSSRSRVARAARLLASARRGCRRSAGVLDAGRHAAHREVHQSLQLRATRVAGRQLAQRREQTDLDLGQRIHVGVAQRDRALELGHRVEQLARGR